jgi:hypothetical protein
MPTFEGTSKNDSFQEALETAIKSAYDSGSAYDRMTTYTVTKISGRRGSIAGFKELTVTIDAQTD